MIASASIFIAYFFAIIQNNLQTLTQRISFLKRFGILHQTTRRFISNAEALTLFYLSGFHIIFVLNLQNLGAFAEFSLKKANFASHTYDNEQKLHNNPLVQPLVGTSPCRSTSGKQGFYCGY